MVFGARNLLDTLGIQLPTLCSHVPIITIVPYASYILQPPASLRSEGRVFRFRNEDGGAESDSSGFGL